MKLTHWYLEWQVRLFLFIVKLLPFKAAQRLGGWLGGLAYYLVPESPEIARTQLKECFPEQSADWVKRTARTVYINQGKNLFEFLAGEKLYPDKIKTLVKFNGLEKLHQCRAEGRGILFCTAHLGNWELLGMALAAQGIPVTVAARKIYLERLNEMLVSRRQRYGVKVILRDDIQAARSLLLALKNRELVGILIDQDTRVQGCFVPFFGRPAWTPIGLARLYQHSQAKIFAGFIYRQKDDTHLVEIEGPYEFDKIRDGSAAKLEQRITAFLTGRIELAIRRRPDQWVWFHQRWKTKEFLT